MRLISLCFSLFLLALPATAMTPDAFEAAMLRVDALYLQGNLPEAGQQALEVYTSASDSFGPTSVYAIRARRSQINMLREQGYFLDGLRMLEELYTMVGKEYLPTHPQATAVAMDYAIALSNSDQTSQALPIMADAVARAEYILGPDDPTTLSWQYHLAALYARMGYRAEALEVFAGISARLEAKVRAGAVDHSVLTLRAEIVLQTARVQNEAKDYAASSDSFALAVEYLSEFWGPAHPKTLWALTEYCKVIWDSRQREALPGLIQQARAGATRTFGTQSLIMAEIEELDALYLSSGGPGQPGFKEGLAAQLRGISIREAILPPDAPSLGRALLNYSAMIQDTGDTKAALDAALRAEKADNGSRDHLFQLVHEAAEKGVLTHQQAGEEFLRLVQSSFTSDAGRAAMALGMRLSLGEGDDAQELRAMTDLQDRQAYLSGELLNLVSLPKQERDANLEFTLREEISKAEADVDALFRGLYDRRPELEDFTQNSNLSLREVRALLGPDDALVVLDIGSREGAEHLALAVTREEIAFASLNWTAESFSLAAGDIRKGISLRLGTRAAQALDDTAAAPEGFDFYAANWLYRETIGRVDSILEGKKHLYIDARGVMASIPPHLLIVKDDLLANEMTADWLIRHSAITVLPSVFSLKLQGLSRGKKRAAAPLLGFANPSYAGTGIAAALPEGVETLRGALSPLPETANELAQVALALGADGVAQRTGEGATEAGLKQTDLTQYGILYFATHGLVSGDAVGEAVLGEPALALTAGEGEDGLLTATEIARLDLNADWVVLSACNTAVGDEPGAEALSGLARAFTYAGARSLLVSHWPVESRSAVRLMTDIFKRRAADPALEAAQAQRQAILAMIETPPNPAWSHPAYWAPFVLVGNPD